MGYKMLKYRSTKGIKGNKKTKIITNVQTERNLQTLEKKTINWLK